MKKPILQLIKVNKSFGGVKVLKDIDLTLNRGTILGLVGENGAGKSTMMNILGGVIQRNSGEVLLEGEPYHPHCPAFAAQAGIAFIHQELNLFLNMTVAENIFIDKAPKSTMGFISHKEMNCAANKILSELGIDIDPTEICENLPMGMRQMVEIAKAMAKKAKIIFFDEPTTSLSTKEKEKLFEIINKQVKQGISMIYISHTLEDVMYLCDEIAVLRDGELIDQQDKKDMTKEKMISMMVGREMSQLFPYIEKTIGKEYLKVDQLTNEGVFKDISFTLHGGEIVGMFGLMGAGRSEVARAIYGVDPMASGEIYYKEQKINSISPMSWNKAGVAFITENRRDEGLLMPKTVKENLILADLKTMRGKMGIFNYKKEEQNTARAIDRLRIKTYDKSEQIARNLSGGNQQKVVIGKWLITEPDVFIIDEPTRGVDVGAKFEIYTHINNLAKEGSAILFISSEMEELIGVCDRILIMAGGRITGELLRKEFNQEKLLKKAIEGGENDEIQ